MFHSITINLDHTNHTFGNIVECLLFYDEVNLIVGIDGMAKLWRAIGPNDLQRLCDYGLHIYVLIDPITCAAIPGQGEDIWTFFLQNEDMRQRVFEKALKELYGTEQLGAEQKNIASRYRELSNEYRHSNKALAEVHEDIYKHFVHKKILQAQLEEIGSSMSMFDPANKYEFRPAKKGFVYRTNLLCGELEEQAKRAGYDDMYFRHQRFLMEMGEVYSLMYFAAEKESTLCTSSSQSLIMSCKQKDMLERRLGEQITITNFEKIETNSFNDLVGAVDSREKTIGEIVELLDVAQEFKQWKRDLPDTADFILEYQKAMSAQLPWVQRTPIKVLRFLITNVAGFIPVVGNVVSAFDTFVVDKWKAGGWKPAQFVTGNLKKFMDING